MLKIIEGCTCAGKTTRMAELVTQRQKERARSTDDAWSEEFNHVIMAVYPY